jgi:hypothetical protein
LVGRGGWSRRSVEAGVVAVGRGGGSIAFGGHGDHCGGVERGVQSRRFKVEVKVERPRWVSGLPVRCSAGCWSPILVSCLQAVLVTFPGSGLSAAGWV